MEIGESDHRPLVTFISHEQDEPKRMFRFNSRMSHKDGFRESVYRGWKGLGQMQMLQKPLAQRLKQCRHQISVWKRHNRSNTEELIHTLRGRLDQAIVSNSATTQDVAVLKDELNQAYLEEEIFWKQRSRVMWLRAGDKNTKYFHSITKMKRNRMHLSSIQDSNGVIHRGQKQIALVAQEYFQTLFRNTEDNSQLYADIFGTFQRRVTDEMNADLTKDVTIEEIQAALFDIGAHKAPGPDGFSAIFYHQYWEDIQPEIVAEVQKFFDEGILDPLLNHTNLCLIPKVYPPTGMTEFRPIALCNVAYKVISKILVNRLKQHLSGMISENQAAFIPGRMITDNVIIAHEIFHSLKVRKRQSTSYMAIKTDITKAYDRLQWDFLEETMKNMGFARKWIDWIMTCISLVTYSVLVNGSPEGHIVPERGIRQRRPSLPLSLYFVC